MLKAAVIVATLVASPVFAGSWNGSTTDGIRLASVTTKSADELAVMCDVGINAPISAVTMTINGTSPMPNSTVMLQFDKDAPIYATTDDEGGIGTFTHEDVAQFNRIITLMKSKSKVKARLFNGETATFALRGSSAAIGDECAVHGDTMQMASQ
ncbi:hypothetical protein BFP76_06485 [Amylibacter kogurei]|uniref:Uncharacterized protein n=1 Tax=Paramylibacter kogurei TaxID=1889778 RepID=A0A2G5K724_9RHOB|nr:hypothetical protein [Amylibacter kogurei]PIB24812.1 hypothetical protein BFP76_06485 [Amylibacter kogurei]